MALAQPDRDDPLEDAIREWADTTTRLAELLREFLDSQKPPPPGRGPRMTIVR